eukprot:jgi/Chlat1/8305/Chrsp78S07717
MALALGSVTASLGRLSIAAPRRQQQQRPRGLQLASSRASLRGESLSVRSRKPAAATRAFVLEIVAKQNAEKRTRQNETRRMRNKARKSELRTRVKKVVVALEALRKNADKEALEPVEKLLGEAYSVIDKCTGKGTLHKNTAARKKSAIARLKRTVLIELGWYTPTPATDATASA